MQEKFSIIQEQFDYLNQLLSEPRIISSHNDFKKLKILHGQISPLIDSIEKYKKVRNDIENVQELRHDPEFKKEAEEELKLLNKLKTSLEKKINIQMVPIKDEDSKDVVLEIRAGTGGEEAALFARDIYNMFVKYAERKNWEVENLGISYSALGGLKEIICGISGKNVYRTLKFESGVHRVQRVPVTEASGRIHTSAITVAILPEAEDVEVEIDPQDLKIDVFRSSGPGGQSVNTTDSAVRITHIPTGIVVSCQDEKSQHKNKSKALRVLRARLYDLYLEDQKNKESSDRKKQVGTGDRSERIRTYSYPQGRVTDHRVGLTLYKLDSFLEGEIDEIINALIQKNFENEINDADIVQNLIETLKPYRKAPAYSGKAS